MAAPLPPAIERLLGGGGPSSARPAPLPPRPPNRLTEQAAAAGNGAAAPAGGPPLSRRSCGLGSLEHALETIGVKLIAAESHEALLSAGAGGSCCGSLRPSCGLSACPAAAGSGSLDVGGGGGAGLAGCTAPTACRALGNSGVGGAIAAYLAGAARDGLSSVPASPALSATGMTDWHALTSSLGAALGCDDSAMAVVSSLAGFAPLSPPLRAMLGEALTECDSVDSNRGELQQAVLNELASSALEILQQEQADYLPSLPPLPSPFLGTARFDAPSDAFRPTANADAIRASLRQLNRISRAPTLSPDLPAESVPAGGAALSLPGGGARMLAAGGAPSCALTSVGGGGGQAGSTPLSVAERLLLCGRLAGNNRERLHRVAPKTPPRKKCEACGALNPTARQCCCACGTRFVIKQKKHGRRPAGGGSTGGGEADDTGLPPLQPVLDTGGGGVAGSALLTGGGLRCSSPPCGAGVSSRARFADAELESYFDGVSGDCLGEWGPDSVATFGIIPAPDSAAGSEDEANTEGGGTAAGLEYRVEGDEAAPRGVGAGGLVRGVSRPRLKKTCPSCSTANALAALTCSFCEAKFSVAQTAMLLRGGGCAAAEAEGVSAGGGGGGGAGGVVGGGGGGGGGVGVQVAQLESPVETDAATVGPAADVSAKAFAQLPFAAQIQVMQEKAAQRLLAETLHRHMTEELASNPSLAADPKRQQAVRHLAHQQLLYQMALTCHAAAPGAEADHLLSLRSCLAASAADADLFAPHDTAGGGPDARAWEEALGVVSGGGLAALGLPASAATAAGAFDDISRAMDGLKMAAVAAAEAERRLLGRAEGRAGHTHQEPAGGSGGVSSHRRPRDSRRKRRQQEAEGRGDMKRSYSGEGRVRGRAAGAEAVGRNQAEDVIARRGRHKRSAWGSESEIVSRVPTRSAKRLLKQLADFNPPGDGDSAPNVHLPNEKVAQTRGRTWDGEWQAKWGEHAAGGGVTPPALGARAAGGSGAPRAPHARGADTAGRGAGADTGGGTGEGRASESDESSSYSDSCSGSDSEVGRTAGGGAVACTAGGGSAAAPDGRAAARAVGGGGLAGVGFRRNESVSAALTLSQGLGDFRPSSVAGGADEATMDGLRGLLPPPRSPRNLPPPPPHRRSALTDVHPSGTTELHDCPPSCALVVPSSAPAAPSDPTVTSSVSGAPSDPTVPSSVSGATVPDGAVRFRRNVSVAAAEALSALTGLPPSPTSGPRASPRASPAACPVACPAASPLDCDGGLRDEVGRVVGGSPAAASGRGAACSHASGGGGMPLPPELPSSIPAGASPSLRYTPMAAQPGFLSLSQPLAAHPNAQPPVRPRRGEAARTHADAGSVTAAPGTAAPASSTTLEAAAPTPAPAPTPAAGAAASASGPAVARGVGDVSTREGDASTRETDASTRESDDDDELPLAARAAHLVRTAAAPAGIPEGGAAPAGIPEGDQPSRRVPPGGKVARDGAAPDRAAGAAAL